MARARFRDIALRGDGTGVLKVVANPQVTVYEPGTTTPLAQTLYDSPSGGAALPNPFVGAADGTFEFYVDNADDADIVVNGVASGVGTYSMGRQPVFPEAAGLLYSGMFSNFFRIGTNAGNVAMILNDGGVQPIPVGSALSVQRTVPATANGYSTTDTITTVISTVAADIGSVRGITEQVAGTVGALIRGGEFHGLRWTGVPAAGTWGIECGVHSQVAGNGTSQIVGIYLYCDDSFFGTGLTQRGDSALLITGAVGWNHGIRYVDTNGSTVLFDVSQVGTVVCGHILPLTNATYSLGDGVTNWANLYLTHALTMLKAGTRANPVSGYSSLYPQTDERWYRRTSAGTQVRMLDTLDGPNRVLNYDVPNDIMNGSAISAATWTDISVNQTFTVADATSIVKVVLRGAMLLTNATVNTTGTIRINIDSAGTPVTQQVAGNILPVASGFMNPFNGNAPVFITGLAAGSHTIKAQVQTNIAATGYLRAATVPSAEYLNITVIEYVG